MIPKDVCPSGDVDKQQLGMAAVGFRGRDPLADHAVIVALVPDKSYPPNSVKLYSIWRIAL